VLGLSTGRWDGDILEEVLRKRRGCVGMKKRGHFNLKDEKDIYFGLPLLILPLTF
jgi:hypothetical protein